MGKKKTNSETTSTPRPKRAAKPLARTLEDKVAYAGKVVGNVRKVVEGRGIGVMEFARALDAIGAIQSIFAAFPDDWKRPRMDGKGGGGAFVPGGKVQLKEKHLEKYDGALPGTGLEVVKVVGPLVQVKVVGTEACAFVPRVHLEPAAEEVVAAPAA